MRIALAVVMSLLVTGCSLFGIRSGTEQPDYQVVAQIGEDIEVRRYPPRLAAETSVQSADEEEARRAAFRRLFDYISGANTAAQRIEMTAPVQVDAEGEKIAMTAPVQTEQPAPGMYLMRFFLPASFSAETAPQPTDSRVRLTEVPEQTLAVLRFSGSRSAAAVARQRARLLDGLAGSGWQADGDVIDWFYDPPWTIPFLRRIEVAVPVTSR